MLRNEEDSFGNGGVPNTTGTWRKYGQNPVSPDLW